MPICHFLNRDFSFYQIYYALALTLRAEQREILQIRFLCDLLPRFTLTYRTYYKAALINHLYRLFHAWEQAAGP